MSNFTANIKHPVTGKKVKANFIDDYFGLHEYGVLIEGVVYQEKDIEKL